MCREMSWEEVEQHHGDADTVWTVIRYIIIIKIMFIIILIRGRVYDVTAFLAEHPGGAEIIKDNAGLDSTEQFLDVGHSKDAWEMLKDYEIGTVEGEETEDKKTGRFADKDYMPFLWIPVAVAILTTALVLRLTVFRK